LSYSQSQRLLSKKGLLRGERYSWSIWKSLKASLLTKRKRCQLYKRKDLSKKRKIKLISKSNKREAQEYLILTWEVSFPWDNNWLMICLKKTQMRSSSSIWVKKEKKKEKRISLSIVMITQILSFQVRTIKIHSLRGKPYQTIRILIIQWHNLMSTIQSLILLLQTNKKLRTQNKKPGMSTWRLCKDSVKTSLSSKKNRMTMKTTLTVTQTTRRITLWKKLTTLLRASTRGWIESLRLLEVLIREYLITIGSLGLLCRLIILSFCKRRLRKILMMC